MRPVPPGRRAAAAATVLTFFCLTFFGAGAEGAAPAPGSRANATRRRSAPAARANATRRRRQEFFEIEPLPEALQDFSPWFSRYVSVFGIHIVATPGERFPADYWTTPFDDDTLLYAANIMAQWIDNDEDGLPDDPRIIESMINENALLWMTPTDAEPESDAFMDDFSDNRPSGFGTQFLHGEETVRYPAIPVPEGTRFDACPEETQHLVRPIHGRRLQKLARLCAPAFGASLVGHQAWLAQRSAQLCTEVHTAVLTSAPLLLR